MASSPFLADDQRDEDFFDKLVDDQFSIAGSGSDPNNKAREIANASIGDVGASLEDSANGQFAASEKVRQENEVMQAAVAEEKKSEVGSPPSLPAATRAASFGSEESQETMTEIGSPGSSMGKSSTSKGTSVKEVQWSAFNVDLLQRDSGGFGSGTAFFTENVDGSDHEKSSLAENSAADISTFLGSFGQEDSRYYGLANEQITEANGPQNWEKVYPGWKLDTNTGHWYQIDGYDAATTAQLENCNVASESMQESYQEKILGAGNGNISDQRSEISYLQQTAKSITGTIAEDHLTGNISSWNQVSQDNIQYPTNMIFDPQYPGWYYDINTQQWQTFESYTQAIQKTTGNVQDQLSQELKASVGFAATKNSSLSNEVGQHEQSTTKGHGSQDMAAHWNGSGSSRSSHVQQTTWLPAQVSKGVTGFSGNHRIGNSYSSTGCVDYYMDHQKGYKTLDSGHNYGDHSSATEFQSVIPEERTYQFNQPKVVQSLQEHLSESYHAHQNSTSYAQQPIQSENASYFPFSYAPKVGWPSAGRPPHALVSFGFGGKLIVMKDSCSFSSKVNYGSHGAIGGTVSILGLRETVMDKTDASSNMTGCCHYFHALCQQSFPGPLVGGSAAAKDVNKWIDEKIAQCQSPLMEVREGELLRLLLSFLKILYQHYGKLRTPFGADLSVEDPDGPQAAVTKLFASASKNGSLYGSFTHCMQNVPSEAHTRATAIEVQNLLASARRKEALQCAQAGQLWGPALVLAAQLGEKFYVDTVRQMAHHQFISGSPLRTLCLLIAGQPAEVFSVESSTNTSFSGADSAAQQSTKVPADGMLDDWKENLAIITANRTKDDELVIVHLGDCLWKEKGEITAAHTCYLVAEAAFESYSDSARMCLIGADHWKFPRTYASPEAIQRTELYEYSKVLGNSQFILLPFQPYKLVYACMLAEVGKVSESLRYCQATLKLLKNSRSAPEVEMWKSLLSSLEERIRTHQHGGYSASLAPANLVGKLFTSIDSTIHRIMGTPASSLPPMPQNGVDGKQSYSVASKVVNSQSTMAMSSLIPSGSVEAISEWTVNGSRKTIHSRSISEPDFSRNSKQDPSKDANSPDSQGQTLLSGRPFRFGRFGSQVLQKTMGWVSRSRPDRQAKLGERNKFYYDEKLKRWVEEGAGPPAEEASLPPPPTSVSFQNGQSDYNINSPFRSPSITANGGSEKKSARPSEHGSGIPPMSPSPNQFSVRGRMGVRSRYVDTFNKGRGIMTNSFQSPSASSVKPALGARLFVPGIPATSDEQAVDRAGESIQEATTNKELSTSIAKEKSFSALSPPVPSSMQRISSMNNIAPYGNKGDVAALQNRSSSVSSHTRAASWDGGGYGDTLTYKTTEMKPSRDGLDVPSNFIPSSSSSFHLSSSSFQLNGGD